MEASRRPRTGRLISQGSQCGSCSDSHPGRPGPACRGEARPGRPTSLTCSPASTPQPGPRGQRRPGPASSRLSPFTFPQCPCPRGHRVLHASPS